MSLFGSRRTARPPALKQGRPPELADLAAGLHRLVGAVSAWPAA
jgi:hypothetical protein